MKVRFYDISWDTSDNSDDTTPPDLPNECCLDVDDDVDLEESGADKLSDEFGFCVYSFNYEVLT